MADEITALFAQPTRLETSGERLLMDAVGDGTIFLSSSCFLSSHGSQVRIVAVRRIFFYAAPSDIKPVLKIFEAVEPLQFVETGNFSTMERLIYINSDDLPSPGVATNSSSAGSVAYLVARDGTEMFQREIDGMRNTKRWVLSAGENETSVTLTMAGLWKDNFLLQGSMTSMHDTELSQGLMKRFLASIKKVKFQKIDLSWIGAEALDMLKAGARLTQSEMSSPQHHVRLG